MLIAHFASGFGSSHPFPQAPTPGDVWEPCNEMGAGVVTEWGPRDLDKAVGVGGVCVHLLPELLLRMNTCL